MPAVCENNREYFRDVFDHLLRMNGSLDNLRDTIGTAIQVNLAMVAIEDLASANGTGIRTKTFFSQSLGRESAR